MGGLLAGLVAGLGNAGLIAQILGGLSGGGASAGAGAAAAAGTGASPTPPPVPQDQPQPSKPQPKPPATTGRTIILSGDEALEWLKNHGLVGSDGKFTDKFNQWSNALPSERTGGTFHGIAWSGGDNPGKDVAIVVDEPVQTFTPPPVPEQIDILGQKPQPVPETEPQEPAPPEKPEPPEEKKSVKEHRKPHKKKSPEPSKDTQKTDPTKKPEKEAPQKPEPDAKKPEEAKQPPPEQPAPMTPAQEVKKLQSIMEKVIKTKTKEGYYVRNPNLFKKAFNNSVGRIIEWIGGYKGGQCGEFGEWGMKWSKKDIKKYFGKDALVCDIVCERNRWMNHRATRVILPNGDKYVLDYWEGMQKGKPAVYKEEKWVQKWKQELGGNPEISRSVQEDALKEYIQKFGKEKGKEVFRKFMSHSKLGEAIIKAYEKNPW